MPKVNVFSALRIDALPTKEFVLKSSKQDFQPKITVQRLCTADFAQAMQRGAEYADRFVVGRKNARGEMLEPMPMPLANGVQIIVREATCWTLAQVELAQIKSDEKYSFPELAALCMDANFAQSIQEIAIFVQPETDVYDDEDPDEEIAAVPPLEPPPSA